MSTVKTSLTMSGTNRSNKMNRMWVTLAPLVCAVLFLSLPVASAYGQQLYVANVGTQAATPTIEILDASTWNLTWQGPNPDPLPGPPLALALGPKIVRCKENRFFGSICSVYGTLYVATGTGTVVRYSINPGGTLSTQQWVMSGSTPRAMIATGTNLYVANRGSNSISVFAIDSSTGGLTPVQTVTGVTMPDELALDPSTAVLVSSGGSTYCGLRIQPMGTLSAPVCLDPLSKVPSSSKIVFAGGFLFLTVNASPSAVQAFRVDPIDLSFTHVATLFIGPGVLADITTVPGVNGVYVARTNVVTLVSLPAKGIGPLRVLGDFPVPGTPGRMLADPRGARLFVTDTFHNQVNSLTIGQDGAITARAFAPLPGQKLPMSMALFVP